MKTHRSPSNTLKPLTQITPIGGGSDGSIPLGQPYHAKVGYRATLSGYGDSKVTDEWVAEADVAYAATGPNTLVTLSGTYNATFSVFMPTIRLREIVGLDDAINDAIIDSPFPAKLRLFEIGSSTQVSTATGPGGSVSGINAAQPGYTVTVSIQGVAANTGSGSWSVSIPSAFSQPPVTSGSGSYVEGTISGGGEIYR